jgi:hypothetical protein
MQNQNKKEICGIYLITERETGRSYVGQARDIEGRWRTHQKKRFPLEHFEYRHIMTCPAQDLDFWEIFYIEKMWTHWTRGGFNRNRGGQYYPRPDEPLSPETKKKISEARKSREASMTPEEKKERSEAVKAAMGNEETKKKISEAKKGNSNGWKGKTHSEESKKKNSEAQKAREASLTEEEKQKRVEAAKAIMTEEKKKRISEACKARHARNRAAKAAAVAALEALLVY